MGQDETPVMVRCQSCSAYYGALQISNQTLCPKCGTVGGTVVERAKTTSELAKMVASANSPREIRHLLETRFEKDSQPWQVGNRDVTPSRIVKILRQLVDDEGLVHESDVITVLEQRGVIQSDAIGIIESVEAEGFLLRVEDGVWRWVE